MSSGSSLMRPFGGEFDLEEEASEEGRACRCHKKDCPTGRVLASVRLVGLRGMLDQPAGKAGRVNVLILRMLLASLIDMRVDCQREEEMSMQRFRVERVQ